MKAKTALVGVLALLGSLLMTSPAASDPPPPHVLATDDVILTIPMGAGSPTSCEIRLGTGSYVDGQGYARFYVRGTTAGGSVCSGDGWDIRLCAVSWGAENCLYQVNKPYLLLGMEGFVNAPYLLPYGATLRLYNRDTQTCFPSCNGVYVYISTAAQWEAYCEFYTC